MCHNISLCSLHPGVAEDYQMPYQNLVPADPSFEDMKKTVVTEKLRPTLPNRWTQSEVRRQLLVHSQKMQTIIKGGGGGGGQGKWVILGMLWYKLF